MLPRADGQCDEAKPTSDTYVNTRAPVHRTLCHAARLLAERSPGYTTLVRATAHAERTVNILYHLSNIFMNELMLLYRLFDKSSPPVHARGAEPQPLQHTSKLAK